MARVFAVPTYDGVHGALLDAVGKLGEKISARLIDCAMPTFDYGMYEDEYVMRGIDSDEAAELCLPIANANAHAVASAATACSISRSIGKRIVADSEAIDRLFKLLVTSSVGVSKFSNINADESLGKALSAAGTIAGMASPGPTVGKIKGVVYGSAITPAGIQAARLVRLADDLRLGAAPAALTKAFGTASTFNFTQKDIDHVTCATMRHVNTSLSQALQGISVWFAGRYTCFEGTDVLIVIDDVNRAKVAECVYSYGMWCIIAANSGGSAGATAISYVHRVLVDAAAPKCWELARYIKNEYAVIICASQAEKDDELYSRQIEGLGVECEATKPACIRKRFSDVMGSSPDAINFGTVWNVLPACAIDAETFIESFRRKVSSRKKADVAAWADFKEYAYSTITAHYLAANPECEIRWARGTGGESKWAQACRDGTLTYPSRADIDWMVGTIPWMRVMETWHHSAQDVTHVYPDRNAAVDNELEYALKFAPLLGGKYTPEFVRAEWARGVLPGERVLYLAGKSENTKFGPKVRETASGDGPLRELLSEIDVNLTAIGHVIDGVTTRRGRGATESMIKKVVGNLDGDRVLISLDVSGWSPNMVRDQELDFVDGLLRMFDLPAGCSAKTAFATPTVVFDKAGVKRAFPMVDGSVQGFFGMADTILHSLMAQWAFSNGKMSGVFRKDSKMRKAALIDDIICCLTGCNVPRNKAVEFFTKQYARLGFSVDVVKTIAASNLGTFLNRVYTPTGEILTYAKIASRADREWDRPVIGICDEVNSIFGGYSGAVDRGLNTIVGYTLACIRVAGRVRALMGSNWAAPDSFIPACFLAPVTLGGLGAPSITEWITGSGADAIENKLANIACVYAQAAVGQYSGTRNLEHSMRTLVSRDLVVRRGPSLWSDPSAVKCKELVDAREPARRALRDALENRYKASIFLKMATARPSEAASEYLTETAADGAYDGPVMKDAWSCTPYSVGDAMMDRFVSSARLLRMIPRVKLYSVLRQCRMRSKEIIKFSSKPHYGKLYAGPLTGVAMHTHLLDREGATLAIPNVKLPGVSATIGHCQERSHIATWIPACADVTVPPDFVTPGRSFKSDTVRISIPTLDLAKDPVLTAIRNLIRVANAAVAGGMDGSALYTSFMAMWGVEEATPPYLQPPDVSHFRLLGSTMKSEHTVRALPNYSSRITVSVSRGLESYRTIHKTFDWMTIAFYIRAIGCVDADAGFSAAILEAGHKEAIRHYTVQLHSGLIRAPVAMTGAVRVLREAQKCIAAHSATNFHALLFDKVGESLDESPGTILARIAGAVGSEATFAINVSYSRLKAPMDMGQFIASMASDIQPSSSTAASSDVVATVHGAARNDIIARYVDKWSRSRDFHTYVADHGGDLAAELDKSKVGWYFKKQIFSRNAEKCNKAMKVLARLRSTANVGGTEGIRELRLMSAEDHRVRYSSKDFGIGGQAKDIIMWHCAERLAPAAHASGPAQLAEAIEAFSAAVHGYLGKSELYIEGRATAVLLRRTHKAITLERFLAACHDVLVEEWLSDRVVEGPLFEAMSKVYGWVIDDVVVPEARSSLAQAAAQEPVAAVGVDEDAFSFMENLIGGALGIGADVVDDDADAEEGNADV